MTSKPQTYIVTGADTFVVSFPPGSLNGTVTVDGGNVSLIQPDGTHRPLVSVEQTVLYPDLVRVTRTHHERHVLSRLHRRLIAQRIEAKQKQKESFV